jgi:hypothetical protein
MRIWFLPSFHGDFRLTAGDDEATSKLLIMAPTPHEVQLLNSFLSKAHKKKWTRELLSDDDVNDTRTIILKAPLAKTGPLLVKTTKPADRTLTAVSFKDGRLEVAETGALETLVARAENDKDAKDAKAVSVSRPTPCCPRCEVGSIAPAREVLMAFLSPQEHADWAEHRAIIVRGGTSGHRYLLAHRNSPTAARLGKICYDLEEHFVLHFHQTEVPPEEEILAAKLILEHREPWLRNEATCLLQTKDGRWRDLGFMRYKNPFGDDTDGRVDAAITATFGIAVEAAARAVQRRKENGASDVA